MGEAHALRSLPQFLPAIRGTNVSATLAYRSFRLTYLFSSRGWRSIFSPFAFIFLSRFFFLLFRSVLREFYYHRDKHRSFAKLCVKL